jgi:hypothetical protein
MDAIKITRPVFNEQNIDRYSLSYNEIVLINKLGIYYSKNNDRPRCIRIFERLRESMNSYSTDESEKIKMYPLILYNYSKQLGLQKRYEEALSIINEGEIMGLKFQRLNMLPGYALNKACDLLEMGNKEKTFPLYAQAYYGSVAIGNNYNQKAITEFTKEKFDLVFD